MLAAIKDAEKHTNSLLDLNFFSELIELDMQVKGTRSFKVLAEYVKDN